MQFIRNKKADSSGVVIKTVMWLGIVAVAAFAIKFIIDRVFK
jgi:hypothetical protein